MDEYYTTDRATVVITGNVEDPKKAIGMVDKIFSGIPKRTPAPRVPVQPIDLKYRKVVHELDIERPLVVVAWKIPPRNSKDYPKANALGNLVGKLAQEADEWEFATSVGAEKIGGELAPAFIVGQLCDIVDLDGPLLLARDRTPGAQYENGRIWCGPEIWGAP